MYSNIDVLHIILELYFNQELLGNLFMTGLTSDIAHSIMSNQGVNLTMLLDKFRDTIGDNKFIHEFTKHLDHFCSSLDINESRYKKNFSQEKYYFGYDIKDFHEQCINHYLDWSHNIPDGVTYKVTNPRYITKYIDNLEREIQE